MGNGAFWEGNLWELVWGYILQVCVHILQVLLELLALWVPDDPKSE